MMTAVVTLVSLLVLLLLAGFLTMMLLMKVCIVFVAVSSLFIQLCVFFIYWLFVMFSDFFIYNNLI